ncbi:MAG: relaxase [Chitinophagaceae bacterium]|nr:relaxase [Chitinophagaceae bacterium]
MVARITMPASIQTALNYNEQKVQKGHAQCIGEANFLLPLDYMNFYHKLSWFENRNALNERAATKTIHISLNFDPSENYENDKLKQIASEYMSQIGFAEQPYLIYKHLDAGHPHIHIVSTTIKDDGSRINTHNIGRNQSEKARKDIENKYALVPANKLQQRTYKTLVPFPLSRLEYGKSETRHGIANIVSQVAGGYNYSSLAQYNAVLQLFSVIADRGEESGFIYSKQGLVYCVLDKEGKKIGVPIKASSLPGKPTLSFLEGRFALNKSSREPMKLALQKLIDKCLLSKPGSLTDLIGTLSALQIQTLLRQNDEGRIYGITFIDLKNKCVFNGSEIGKGYCITGIQKSFTQTLPVPSVSESNKTGHRQDYQRVEHSLAEQMLRPEMNYSNTPYHLKKKQKRKKKNL